MVLGFAYNVSIYHAKILADYECSSNFSIHVYIDYYAGAINPLVLPTGEEIIQIFHRIELERRRHNILCSLVNSEFILYLFISSVRPSDRMFGNA